MHNSSQPINLVLCSSAITNLCAKFWLRWKIEALVIKIQEHLFFSYVNDSVPLRFFLPIGLLEHIANVGQF